MDQQIPARIREGCNLRLFFARSRMDPLGATSANSHEHSGDEIEVTDDPLRSNHPFASSPAEAVASSMSYLGISSTDGNNTPVIDKEDIVDAPSAKANKTVSISSPPNRYVADVGSSPPGLRGASHFASPSATEHGTNVGSSPTIGSGTRGTNRDLFQSPTNRRILSPSQPVGGLNDPITPLDDIPSPTPPMPTLDTVPHNSAGLRALARYGRWAAVLELIKKLQDPYSTLDAVGEEAIFDPMILRTCRILSLMKLREFDEAVKDFSRILQECRVQLRASSRDSSYDSLDDNEIYSLVEDAWPFTLRVLYAELKHRQGQSDACTDHLFRLLWDVRANLKRLGDDGVSPVTAPVEEVHTPVGESSRRLFPISPGELEMNESYTSLVEVLGGRERHSELSVWRARESRVIFSIVNLFILKKNFSAATQLCQQLQMRYPDDVLLMSRVGRIYLQLGDLVTAEKCFKTAEQIRIRINAPELPIVHMNSGLLAFARSQYGAARQAFERVLEIDPDNVMAANNCGLCLLYTAHTADAIERMENIIMQNPRENLHETLVFNLCSLYDLAHADGLSRKRIVERLVNEYCPDTFPQSALKL